MKILIMALFIVELITALSVGAYAAEVITIDPNASAPKEIVYDVKTDSRLAREVSYEAVHKPLRVILDDVSQMTGVALYAGYNTNDWQVRDRKMNLFVKDLPLSELMSSIARVMKFKWSCNSVHNPPTYRLLMNRKSIGVMEAQASRKSEELRREVIARRQKFVDTMADVAAMSEDEIEGLKDKNPYLHLSGKTGLAKVVTAVFNDVPQIKKNFLSFRKNMNPSVSSLSPATQRLFLDAMKAYYPYRNWDANAPYPENAESGFERNVMIIENIPRPFSDWEQQPMTGFGGLGCMTDAGFFLLGHFNDPDRESTKLEAKLLQRVVDDGVSPDQAHRELESQLTEAEKANRKIVDPYLMIEPVTEHDIDPELQEKVTVKVDAAVLGEESLPERLAAVEKALAEAGEFNVISDSFAKIPQDMWAGAEDIILQDCLDRLATSIESNWERYDSVIEIHNRDWFRKRAAQVPDEWLERWRESLVKTGTLSLEEFCQIAMLSFPQIDENIFTDPVLKCCGQIGPSRWNIFANLGIIRLYLRLSSSQKELVFTPDGLPLGALSLDQWKLAVELTSSPYCTGWNLERFFENDGSGVFLRGYAAKQANGALEYKLILDAPDRPSAQPPFTYTIGLPKYEPPAKTQGSGATAVNQ